MRIVLQRVSSAVVRVEGQVVGSIDGGLCLLVGAESGDTAEDVGSAVDKILGLRIFPDDQGKMNRSIVDVAGRILIVSQFTLAGDVRKGRRPSFDRAADPGFASALIDSMASAFRDRGIVTEQGVFGARMEVELLNDGPVTFVLQVEAGVVR